MGWNDTGYSRRARDNAVVSGFSTRPVEGKQMASGQLAGALAHAIRTHIAGCGSTLERTLSDMSLGASTWSRMKAGEPVTQSTVLKVVKYLGTSVSAVLTNYQRRTK